VVNSFKAMTFSPFQALVVMAAGAWKLPVFTHLPLLQSHQFRAAQSIVSFACIRCTLLQLIHVLDACPQTSSNSRVKLEPYWKRLLELALAPEYLLGSIGLTGRWHIRFASSNSGCLGHQSCCASYFLFTLGCPRGFDGFFLALPDQFTSPHPVTCLQLANGVPFLYLA